MSTLEFLKNYYQVIFIAIAVSGILFAIVKEYLSFSKWRAGMELKMDDLEPIRKAEIPLKMDDLEPIRKNAKAIAALPEKVEELRSDTEEIRYNIKNIYTKMDIIFQKLDRLPESIFQDASPLSLSEYGQRLADKINAPTIAAKYKERLTRMAKAQNMRPYQIQECCFEYSLNEMLKDLEKNDKEKYYLLTDAAFNEGVEIEKLLKITGLILRDQVLETLNGPNINAETVPPNSLEPTAANQ